MANFGKRMEFGSGRSIVTRSVLEVFPISVSTLRRYHSSPLSLQSRKDSSRLVRVPAMKSSATGESRAKHKNRHGCEATSIHALFKPKTEEAFSPNTASTFLASSFRLSLIAVKFVVTLGQLFVSPLKGGKKG